MFETFCGICLNNDEKIIAESKPSVKALIITWLAIPGFLFITLFLPILCSVIKISISSSISEQIGIQGISHISYAWQSVFGNLVGIYKFLIFFPITLLVMAWTILCLVLTYRHFKYCITITDSRLIGVSRENKVAVSLKRIKNVYCEQSIWGKMLNYGSIIVYTTKGTYEFKSIAFPQKIKNLLIKYASDY